MGFGGFAGAVRTSTVLPTGAVRLITDPQQAGHLAVEGRTDVVLLSRELLRDPQWAKPASAPATTNA